jgi:hypothetical protein
MQQEEVYAQTTKNLHVEPTQISVQTPYSLNVEIPPDLSCASSTSEQWITQPNAHHVIRVSGTVVLGTTQDAT